MYWKVFPHCMRRTQFSGGASVIDGIRLPSHGASIDCAGILSVIHLIEPAGTEHRSIFHTARGTSVERLTHSVTGDSMAFISTRVFFVALTLWLAVSAPLVRADEEQQIESKLQCHMLPIDHCAFAVDSDGDRCVLESIITDNVITAYICQKSVIPVGAECPVEYVETDECIMACGAERLTVGFSTDAFTTTGFTSKLCSTQCREGCPNLVDLYSNIIAGEGTTIAELCSEHRRSMLVREQQMIFAQAPFSSPGASPPSSGAAPPFP
ncbi:hypothetical protein R1flu_019799 [Riccia fluitans]|uniref:PAR1 protein n=1 Tax=Riccia fluitans TaxID=41844 RepID=A0ABD1ZLA1_9MARC